MISENKPIRTEVEILRDLLEVKDEAEQITGKLLAQLFYQTQSCSNCYREEHKDLPSFIPGLFNFGNKEISKDYHA